MRMFRLLKVQSPALDWRLGGRRLRFGAHTFLAAADPDGRVFLEHHGIARGPGGSQLRRLGGLWPFQDEVLWGEAFPHRTGFYDESHPQGVLFAGPQEDLARRLDAAEAVRLAVNARGLRYPWPALKRGNSNTYFHTLLAGMGLADIPLTGALWAPGGRRLLLPRDELDRICAGSAQGIRYCDPG